MNLRHQLARVEIARHENARNAIVWNTECCTCLSIAEQECTSRQERAPDFAADCVLVNDQRPISNENISRSRRIIFVSTGVVGKQGGVEMSALSAGQRDYHGSACLLV